MPNLKDLKGLVILLSFLVILMIKVNLKSSKKVEHLRTF